MEAIFPQTALKTALKIAIWVFFRGLKSKSGYFLGFSKKISDEHTQARIQTGLSGLYKPVRFFRDGSTLNNSHNIFILNLNSIVFHSFSRSSFCIIIRLDLSRLPDFLGINDKRNELKQTRRASTASNSLAFSHIGLSVCVANKPILSIHGVLFPQDLNLNLSSQTDETNLSLNFLDPYKEMA